jgi:hypothetical protein
VILVRILAWRRAKAQLPGSMLSSMLRENGASRLFSTHHCHVSRLEADELAYRGREVEHQYRARKPWTRSTHD